VIGLAIRTTNAAEADPATAQIPGLWSRYSTDLWAERLAKLGAVGPTLAVYSNYERGAAGSYQLLVGREANSPASRVAELQAQSIPPGSYLRFDCPGPLPQAVIDGWRTVWDFFKQPGAPTRAFTTDYEVYADSQPVEIWIAIRQGDSRAP
jgi:predicted transcriptional regulator YdeE